MVAILAVLPIFVTVTTRENETNKKGSSENRPYSPYECRNPMDSYPGDSIHEVPQQ